MRYATLLVALLTAFMGINATMGAAHLWSLPQSREALVGMGDPFASIRDAMQKYDPEGITPRLFSPEVVRSLEERRIDATEQMTGSRALALALLSTACMFAFIASGRLLRRDRMPREGTRRILAGSLLMAAFFRMFVGAQDAAVEQKAMRALPALMQGVKNASHEQLEQLMMAPVVVIGLWTAAMVGLLVLLGQYFRSSRIKQVVAMHDQQLER
jgi:hypothetical protein